MRCLNKKEAHLCWRWQAQLAIGNVLPVGKMSDS